jgi:O-antigen/teichoic acid export membrane protein
MQGRFFTLITAMVVFLVIAFTPIVPVMLHYYGNDNVWLAKTLIGLITLGAGMTFAKALFNKEEQKKEGKLRIKLVPIIAGAVVIALSWYTGLPEMLADWTGTSQAIEENAAEFVTVGIRLWTSVLTIIGVFLIRFGFTRQKEVYVKEPKKKENGESQTMQQIQAWGNE